MPGENDLRRCDFVFIRKSDNGWIAADFLSPRRAVRGDDDSFIAAVLQELGLREVWVYSSIRFSRLHSSTHNLNAHSAWFTAGTIFAVLKSCSSLERIPMSSGTPEA
jgi:hypothetical protein